MDAEKIIKSYNLWVDTDAANLAGQQKGDEYNIALGNQSIEADTGQYIRITLNNFNMYKTWTSVNTNNDTFHIINQTSLAETPVKIENKNYRNLHDLTYNIAQQVVALMPTITGVTGTFTPTNYTPDIISTIPGTTDNILSFDISCSSLSGPLPELQLQAWETDGEAYALMGGDRSASGSNVPTWDISLNADVYHFQGFYPAQRSTTPYVYLRSRTLSNFSVETSSLSEPYSGNPPTSDITTSQILAKIQVGTEMATYNSNYGGDYFINIYNRHINAIALRLTDEHNRPLGRKLSEFTGTATGAINPATGEYYSNKQSTLGNLQFSAVLRVDIVQQTLPQERLFQPVPNPLNPKTSGQFYNPSNPPDNHAPNIALRALTLAENSRINKVQTRAGGIVGRGS